MPLLKEEKIHKHACWALWQITEKEEDLMEGTHFSRQELEELAQVKVSERRLEWLASRLLLKKLATEQGISHPEIKKDAFGKPYVADASFQASLSHAFPFAAAIVHTQRAVGIDIEHSRTQLLRIRHKFLHPEELACAGENLLKLGIYWSAKEALYKLYGRKALQFQAQIRIYPFEDREAGSLQGCLLTKYGKEQYSLHYHHFHGLLVCYTL